ncbi:NUDIX domain-containing protein [Microbacterium sp. H37-C3]|uniref:NUDIX domain-containing protein n=1 Tax=Microbacterium sp. H37-C3 TaxID=3004354 RepID=UPI0022AFD74F|nr:NUDIX domain-containing protein [Microbacterium sp. H37-C3]MCZ4068331.1 NUDIX domain-containing protein [Microbacterium sp. H37-C3]
MTDDPAAAPRPPHGPRDPGDAWVVAPSGERYWGRFGAAGLLAIDPERGVLLQHRVSWSHFGDTWGLPGGARHAGESARDGALRESAEEAGVPADAVAPRFLSVLDVGVWTYGTLVVDVTTPFHPVISDPESRELAWVSIDEVESFPLHPGFAASWPRLRGLLSLRPTVIVDVANVVGSVPDGWWRDRAGAAERLLAQVAALAERGMDAADLELPEDIWFPRVVAVVEGQARDVTAPAGVELARAPAAGDDAIVDATTAAVAAGERVSVVTSDRELRARVEAVGARAVSTSWLRDRL